MQKKYLFKSLNKFFYFLLISLFLLTGCIKFKPVSTKDAPTNSAERAKKNIEEGKGISIGNVFSGGRGTNYEFSTSNPMWRASLETLDFLPLTVVDYSGGVIITDWYGENQNESLKITLRFLSNEIRTDSLRITVHQKSCSINSNCKIKILKSKIEEELIVSIIKKAAILEKDSKKK